MRDVRLSFFPVPSRKTTSEADSSERPLTDYFSSLKAEVEKKFSDGSLQAELKRPVRRTGKRVYKIRSKASKYAEISRKRLRAAEEGFGAPLFDGPKPEGAVA